MKTDPKNSYPQLDTPCLILQEDALLHNLKTAQALAYSSHKKIRPHIKAHKSVEIAKLQLECGSTGICCTKLSEAEVMVEGGIRDILITSPIAGPLKLERLGKLSQKATISIVTDDEQQLAFLSQAATQFQSRLHVLIEIDVGQGRCGVAPGRKAFDIARAIGQYPNLEFAGLQAYQGKLQGIKNFQERTLAVNLAMQKLSDSLGYFKEHHLGVQVVTGGGTGSFPIDIRLPYLTELQLGSYVTMDCNYMQDEWGEGGGKILFQRPLSVLSTVISKPSPNKVIIDAGWKAITNDGGMPQAKNPAYAFEYGGDEHGILTDSLSAMDLQVGDQVELIPSHCDTTVNLYDYLYLVNQMGSRRIPIQARGMII